MWAALDSTTIQSARTAYDSALTAADTRWAELDNAVSAANVKYIIAWSSWIRASLLSACGSRRAHATVIHNAKIWLSCGATNEAGNTANDIWWSE